MIPVTASRFVEQARSWIGVQYRHQGRARSGVDCVGLPIAVLQELGLLPPRFEISNYGRTPSGELVERLQAHSKPMVQAVPGALIVIAWTKVAAHVAICTGGTMIHAYERIGTVVEHGYRGRWVRMTHSVWALPGVLYE
jgi:cell wall-associated NlpC family hydrolase